MSPRRLRPEPCVGQADIVQVHMHKVGAREIGVPKRGVPVIAAGHPHRHRSRAFQVGDFAIAAFDAGAGSSPQRKKVLSLSGVSLS